MVLFREFFCLQYYTAIWTIFKNSFFSTKPEKLYIFGTQIIVKFILVKSLTNIPKWHSRKYANAFSSYFRNNGIQLRKFILNTIYSGVIVRTSFWLMDDKNKVLSRWIELCAYIHELCLDRFFFFFTWNSYIMHGFI